MEDDEPKPEELPKPQDLVERALRAKLEVRQQLADVARRHGAVEANLRQLERQERATSRADRAMAVGKRVREEEEGEAQARKSPRGGPGRRGEREVDEDEQDEGAALPEVVEPEEATKEANGADATSGEAATPVASKANDDTDAPSGDQPKTAESETAKDEDSEMTGVREGRSSDAEPSPAKGLKSVQVPPEGGRAARQERPSPRVSPAMHALRGATWGCATCLMPTGRDGVR